MLFEKIVPYKNYTWQMLHLKQANMAPTKNEALQ